MIPYGRELTKYRIIVSIVESELETLVDVSGSNELEVLNNNALENEAIYILREVAAQFEKPVLLFSGGKDSITLVRLAQKAFFPAKIPFPLMHIDTGHNFPETIAFRDKLVKELGVELIVRNVQDSIDQGKGSRGNR